MTAKTVLLFLLLLPAIPVMAQQPVSTDFIVTRFGEINGMNAADINCMHQGYNGYLWLGSSEGLVRYDGYNFKLYPNKKNAPNSITRITEDKQHRLWVSFSGGGIGCFNPANGSFINYKLINSNDTTISSSDIYVLFFDDAGELWAGIGQKGFVHIDKKTGYTDNFNLVSKTDSFYTPELRNIYNTVYDVYEDSDKILWLATHNGLYRFNPATKEMRATRPAPLKKNEWRNDLFNKILFDNNKLWLSSWGGGISSYDIKTGEWKNFKFDLQHPNSGTTNIVQGITPKNKEEFWVCSSDMGFGLFNKKTEQFNFFSGQSRYKDLPPDLLALMTKDKEGNVWVKRNDDIFKIQSPNYKFHFTEVPVTHSDNKGHYVIADTWENDRYQLIATGLADGLHVMNKQTGKRSIHGFDIMKQEEQFLEIEQLKEDSRGLVWVVTRDYIYQFDFVKNKLIKTVQPPAYSTDLPSNNFSHVTEDGQGNMWFTTYRNGIFMYDMGSHLFTHYSNREAGDHFVERNNFRDAVTDIRGRVWLASGGGFLGYVDPQTKKIVPVEKGYGESIRLSNNKTYALFNDSKGNIWTGTREGLCKFDCNKNTVSLMSIYRAKDGLVSDMITGIREDSNHNIWCIASSGVSVVNPATGSINSYGKQDGINKNDGLYKIVTGVNNQLQILSFGGYYIFDPANMKSGSTNAQLVINSMMVNDREIFYADELAGKGRINLSPGQNLFSFEFAAIDFNSTGRQQYAYMLEGFDKDWNYSGGRHFASYTNIPGGNYVFKVQSSRDKNKWTGAVISIPIHIETPFYKMWWLRLLLVLLVIASIYWWYKSRIAQQQKLLSLQNKAFSLEKEKAMVMYESLKQQLNPHFLFNSLSSLSSLITSNPANAKQFLERMSKIYRYILQSRDNETVSLADELKLAEIYTQLQQTRFKEGLQVNIDVEEEWLHRKIAPVTLQNLVENAIKHNIIDVASPLIINIFVEDEWLVIQNNLQRKNFVETSNKQGLANMQSLYHYLAGRQVHIAEDENYFTIKIPLL